MYQRISNLLAVLLYSVKMFLNPLYCSLYSSICIVFIKPNGSTVVAVNNMRDCTVYINPTVNLNRKDGVAMIPVPYEGL